MNNKKICIAQLLVAMNNICVDEKDARMEKSFIQIIFFVAPLSEYFGKIVCVL